MSDQNYQTSSGSVDIIANKNPKSFTLVVVISLLIGPFLAMLYLARPVRFFLYFTAELFVAYSLVNQSGILNEIHEIIPMTLKILLLGVGITDAWFIRKKLPKDILFPLYSRWYVIIPTTVVVTLTLYLIRGLFVDYLTIASTSMLPNYQPGDLLVIDKSKSAQTTVAGKQLMVHPNQKMHKMVK